MWPALLLAAALSGGGDVASPALGHEPWVWQPEPGEIELFVGNIKMGKSHAARVRTKRIRRMLAWDPQRDEELGSGRLTVLQLEKLFETHPELLVRGTVRLAIRPTAWSDNDTRDEFDRFLRVAWRVGRLAVKVDESGGIVQPGNIPPALSKGLREGRHRELSWIFVGQRFPMVPVIARDNASRLVVFRHGFDDAGDVSRRCSGAGVEVTPEQISALAPHHFLEWTPIEGARIRPPLGS